VADIIVILFQENGEKSYLP